MKCQPHAGHSLMIPRHDALTCGPELMWYLHLCARKPAHADHFFESYARTLPEYRP